MNAEPPEALLDPLRDDAPCGDDLAATPAFLALERIAEGTPEREVGATLIPAQDPDWREVLEQADTLARQTRDLRVAVLLARSASHVHGLAGAVAGLRLVQQLLERHWPHVYPLLDATDHDDPTERLNTLAALAHHEAFLRDLRKAGLTPARGALTVRGIELAIGEADPEPGESVPTEAGVLAGLVELARGTPDLADLMAAGGDAVRGITAAIEAHVPGRAGPDLQPLAKLLGHVAEAARRAFPAAGAGDARAPEVHAVAQGPATRSTPMSVGAIASRDDAVHALERVCEWLERNEPTNPAPLLIRRAQRLMTKDFLDIIRDLLPDGIGEVQKLAGIPHD